MDEQHVSHIKGHTLSVVCRNDLRALINVHLLRTEHPDKPLLGPRLILTVFPDNTDDCSEFLVRSDILALDTCRQ